MPGSGQSLLGRALRGDAAALESLLLEEAEFIRGSLATRISVDYRSEMRLHDVVQETYLHAIRGIGKCKARTRAGFGKWLLTIGKRVVLDMVRGIEAEKRLNPLNRIHSAPGQVTSVSLLDWVAQATTTPSRGARRREDAELLHRAIEALPDDQRKVVTMRALEHRSAADVATAMGRSPAAISMLSTRANDKLRDLLGSQSKFFTT